MCQILEGVARSSRHTSFYEQPNNAPILALGRPLRVRQRTHFASANLPGASVSTRANCGRQLLPDSAERPQQYPADQRQRFAHLEGGVIAAIVTTPRRGETVKIVELAQKLK